MQLIIFPMEKQVGRIREVAARLLDKTSDQASDHYRRQVTDAILLSLRKLSVPEAEHAEQLSAFWRAVNGEMIRLSYARYETGGAA